MKIVVCIKQVPDTKGGVKFKPDGTLDRAAMISTAQKLPLSPWDFPRRKRFCVRLWLWALTTASW